MPGALHLSELYPLDHAQKGDPYPPQKDSWRSGTSQSATTGWKDHAGLVHGNPHCTTARLEPIHATISQLSQMPLCNDPTCINAETLTSQHCPARNARTFAQETITCRVLEFRTLADNHPYLALSEGLLLAQRLNHPSYAPWRNPAVKDHLEHTIKRARTQLSTPSQKEKAREHAAETYLRTIDLGPLDDLRNLLNRCPESHENEIRQLAGLLGNYTGHPTQQQQLEELLRSLETRTYLDNTLQASIHSQAHTRAIRAANATLCPPIEHSWHREVQAAAHRLPHWWSSTRDQLATTTDIAVAYLPEPRVRRNTDYPWELHRLHPASSLLVLPYAAARLAETAHGASIVLTGTPPHPHVLETLEVLVSDETGPLNQRELEVHLRTAELLARQPTR